mgnify:FL=1
MTVSRLILLQCLTIAAGYDFIERRIPHALIYTYLCFGLFLSDRACSSLSERFFLLHEGAFFYLLSYFLSFVMFLMLASWTKAGNGDARLMALVIAWCGVEEACSVLLPGLLLALLYLLWIRKAFCGYVQLSCSKHTTLPLAVPVLLGAIPRLIFAPA